MRTKRRNQLKNGNIQRKSKGNIGKPSIAKWKRREGIELDDEDAFHENRDRIMLEGEEDAGSDDDLKNEVFALRNVQPGSPSSEEELEEVPDETDEAEVEVPKASKSKKALKSAKTSNRKAPVAAASDSSSESDAREQSWGRKKSAYYSTNAAEIGSDDEEGRRLEEAEVIRLQIQARAALDEDDFGIGNAPASSSMAKETIVEAPVQPLSQDSASLITQLEKTSPETLALAREWEDVIYDLARSQQAVDLQDEVTSIAPAAGMLQLYHQTLLTYATTLAFYLHMRAMPKYATNPKLLQSHPVLARLLTLKQAMASLERLDFGPDSDKDRDDEDGEDDESADYEEDMQNLWGDRDLAEMSEDEFQELIKEAQMMDSLSPRRLNNEKVVTHSVRDDKKSTKKLRDKEKKKLKKEKKPVFDLEEPEFIPASKLSAKAKVPTRPDPTSAFGEYTSLDDIDAQDKTARKKSLRFHTSKIESASSRRAKARGAALGGDDDVPYRERDKQREARLLVETEKRLGKLGQGGEDLEIPDESAEKSLKRRRDDNEEDEEMLDVGDDGYYELVKRQRKKAKDEKKEQYSAEKVAERAAREGDADPGQGGPRSLTRAILKNKGLTPSRSKSVRNPRVKKRMKYDEAKKRVRSQKAIFKGGLASTGGRYEGESSGISTKIVKSIKLG